MYKDIKPNIGIQAKYKKYVDFNVYMYLILFSKNIIISYIYLNNNSTRVILLSSLILFGTLVHNFNPSKIDKTISNNKVMYVNKNI